jgi:hypothetical protein
MAATAFGETVDLADKIVNPLFQGTPGTCPTNWVCGGSPAPGFASYAPAAAQYPGGSLFATSAYSPTVLSGSGTIQQKTPLFWIGGNTYVLNLMVGVPKTEPDGKTPVVGWPQTVRLYLTASGNAQVAAFDIPNPNQAGFVSRSVSFTLPVNSPFNGEPISVLIFVSATQNYSANFAIAPACSSLIDNSLTTSIVNSVAPVLPLGIKATFTPNMGYTLAKAAQYCGFIEFNWQQKVTSWPSPSHLLLSDNSTAVTAPPPFLDPPLGGYNYAGTSGRYPFYYQWNTLATTCMQFMRGTSTCILPVINAAGTTLSFFDSPQDSCFAGGVNAGTPNCNGKTVLAGSFLGFTADVVGVSPSFVADTNCIPLKTCVDLGVGFSWKSNYNGGALGGVFDVTASDVLADPTGGTGGVSITSVRQITTYTGTPSAPPTPQTLTAGYACNGTYSGTFNGTIVVSAGQNCTFLDGTITGDVNANGGNLMLSGVLVGGGVQITGNATFSIDGFTNITGDLQISNSPASTAQNQVCSATVQGNIEFQNNGTPAQIGSNSVSSCAGNVVGGNLNVENNLGSVGIFNNTITGNLACTANSSITGSGNTAAMKQGQCSSF